MIFYFLFFAILQAASIEVAPCKLTPLPTIYPFFDTITGQSETTTTAHICHDDEFLNVYWWSKDDDIVSTYSNCNDPLYNEDAVQIFLASNESFPHQYYEFEISPKGQLFFADIMNPNLTCGNLGTVYQPCTSAFYDAEVGKEGKSWTAHLKVDLKIVGRGKVPKVLKGNMFRIDKSRTESTRYLALNPTLAKPACFHRPAAFIDMVLI